MKGNYTNGKETGEWFNHWENGTIKNKTTFSNGQLDGEWKSYHLNGKLALEGAYKKDLKVGEWRKYFSNGKTKELLTYKLFQKKSKFNDAILSNRAPLESRLNGSYESYALKDYKLTESGTYKNGKKNGEWTAFHPGGLVPAVVSNYKDGKLYGPMKTFSRRGVLLQEAQYKNGLRHGKYVVFDRRGRVLKELRYSDGMRVIEGKGSGSFTPR
jgi:antitoxin component YwqK of YwqJK toxin-antitoxin module